MSLLIFIINSIEDIKKSIKGTCRVWEKIHIVPSIQLAPLTPQFLSASSLCLLRPLPALPSQKQSLLCGNHCFSSSFATWAWKPEQNIISFYLFLKSLWKESYICSCSDLLPLFSVFFHVWVFCFVLFFEIHSIDPGSSSSFIQLQCSIMIYQHSFFPCSTGDGH